MAENEKERIVQEKYLQFQMLAGQIREVQQQMQVLDEQLVDMNSVIQDLNKFKKTGNGSDMLVPVHSGIFAKGRITDSNTLFVNVGSGVVVKKDVESTNKLLHTRMEELEKQREHTLNSLHALGRNAQDIEKEISELTK